jgi:hypothetical protein
MPRYFFNVVDGQSNIDTEGTLLRDEAELRQEAIRFAGALLRDGANATLWEGKPWTLEVQDEAGRTVIVLRLTAADIAP